jgi:hypothetical protein
MHNGLPYTLLKRNDVVALYCIGGTYTDEILDYEVAVVISLIIYLTFNILNHNLYVISYY